MTTRPFLYLLAAGLTLASPLIGSASADQPAQRAVTITGQDTVRISATRARLTAMVESQAGSPAAAQATVRKGSQTVLDYLQKSKVESLQAGAMTLYPVYGDRRPDPAISGNEPPEIVAYRAQWNASFEVEAGRAGEMADGLVTSGAGRITGFSFTATDDALAKAQQEALRGAALRARNDAHAVLDALGYKPGEVVRVEVNSSGPAQPMFRRAEMMGAFSSDQGPSTAVEPGLIEVNGSVVIEVAY